MPCESCAVQFSVFRRKRACSECERLYCSACLRSGGSGGGGAGGGGAGGMCVPCRALSTRPLARHAIAHLKVRDLQCFLQRQNVSTRGCVEKDELVSLCVSHVNSASYRRRGQRGPTTGFSSFKGFTNNLNDLINHAFDLRNTAQSAPSTPNRGYCYNATHMHTGSTQAQPPPPPQPTRERFITNPEGQADIRVEVPPRVSPPAENTAPARDTTDCFEIEDLADAGWEFVARPADPLPNDSEELMRAAELRERLPRVVDSRTPCSPPPAGPALPPAPPPAPPPPAPAPHPSSSCSAPSTLEDNTEPPNLPDDKQNQSDAESMLECEEQAGVVSLRRVRSWSQLERLGARQLKLLLARHRVDVAGVLERDELLQRARTLWDHHAKYRDAIESLPLEECCKICMAAPLECVLLECGHIAACVECARQLAECPICRRYVLRAVRCFKS